MMRALIMNDDLYRRAVAIVTTEDATLRNLPLLSYVPKLQQRLHIDFDTAQALIAKMYENNVKFKNNQVKS